MDYIIGLVLVAGMFMEARDGEDVLGALIGTVIVCGYLLWRHVT